MRIRPTRGSLKLTLNLNRTPTTTHPLPLPQRHRAAQRRRLGGAGVAASCSCEIDAPPQEIDDHLTQEHAHTCTVLHQVGAASWSRLLASWLVGCKHRWGGAHASPGPTNAACLLAALSRETPAACCLLPAACCSLGGGSQSIPVRIAPTTLLGTALWRGMGPLRAADCDKQHTDYSTISE